MAQRLDYTAISPQGTAALRALEHHLNTATHLDPILLELIRLRASLLNGCEYCTGLHTHELTKHNETTDRIARVATWRTFDGYTERERAALAWTEAITNIQPGHASDEDYAAAHAHFPDEELVNLTLAIVSINAWNRMAIAFRAEHRPTPLAPEAQPEQSAVNDDGGKVTVDD